MLLRVLPCLGSDSCYSPFYLYFMRYGITNFWTPIQFRCAFNLFSSLCIESMYCDSSLAKFGKLLWPSFERWILSNIAWMTITLSAITRCTCGFGAFHCTLSWPIHFWIQICIWWWWGIVIWLGAFGFGMCFIWFWHALNLITLLFRLIFIVFEFGEHGMWWCFQKFQLLLMCLDFFIILIAWKYAGDLHSLADWLRVVQVRFLGLMRPPQAPRVGSHTVSI